MDLYYAVFTSVKIYSKMHSTSFFHSKIYFGCILSCFQSYQGKSTLSHASFFTTQSRLLTTLCKKPFENFVGKGENAGNQHFLLFPQCFLPFPKQISILQLHLFVICKCLQFGPVQNFVVW